MKINFDYCTKCDARTDFATQVNMQKNEYSGFYFHCDICGDFELSPNQEIIQEIIFGKIIIFLNDRKTLNDKITYYLNYVDVYNINTIELPKNFNKCQFFLERVLDGEIES